VGDSKNVLIVDDESVVSDFLVKLLLLEGVQAKSVDDAYKALEAIKKEKFDFIFLDVRMPKLNGIDALREIKKVDPAAKIVMMTGYAVDALLEEAKQEGAIAALKKPFEIKEIIKLMQEYKD
jgi:DNA-binding NtrC family response regulator